MLRKQIAALPAKANIISRDQQCVSCPGGAGVLIVRGGCTCSLTLGVPCDRFNDLLHQLQQLMSNTFNENISILLMGERGTGKSLVLRSVIRQMREDNPKQPLTEVYLNGFCVRDDSAALREIARQLQRASGGRGARRLGSKICCTRASDVRGKHGRASHGAGAHCRCKWLQGGARAADCAGAR